ncbi:MAG: hypothetical protein J6I84_02565 [Bacilli bacterium]|nr:hypothetical protein [Bacilli bacterium]
MALLVSKKQIENLKFGEKLSLHAKKQMEEGNSIFSPDDIRNENLPSWKNFQVFPSINHYKDIAISLGMDEYNLSIENCILIDKINYIRRGNPEDICIYYLTYFEETSDYFKPGVTIDLKERSNTDYHGYKYKTPEILFTSSRLIIAEIEYEVKLKFKDFIVLGNEAFDIKHKDEILEYIEERINYYNKNEAQDS